MNNSIFTNRIEEHCKKKGLKIETLPKDLLIELKEDKPRIFKDFSKTLLR